MAITRAAAAAVAGGTILAASWESEFNNIINNALALVSPWTGNMAAGGFRLTGLGLGTVGDPSLQFTGDTNTGIFSSAADTVDIAVGGVRGLQVTTIASAVNYIDIRPSATTNRVTIEGEGTDANIGIEYIAKGTGTHLFNQPIVLQDAAPATPVANTLYTDSVVKGWVKFQINGTIDDDLNVSSITDNGVGDWTVNWATAFANVNYSVIPGKQSDSTLTITVDDDNSPTTTATRVTAFNVGGDTPDDPTGATVRIFVIAIGDQ